MVSPSNQDIERYYFEQFRSHFPLPAGDLEYSDKPDVVIHGIHKLGIEIANLYLSDGANPNSEQIQQVRREKVVQSAQELHSHAGGKGIEISVSFSPEHPINDIHSIAESLAAIARKIQDLPAGTLPPSYFAHIPEIWLIYHNPIEYPDALWRVLQVFSVPQLSAERVAQLVEIKDRKLSQYQQCDEYWLLLVVNFFDPAQDQEISWPVGCPPLETSYKRVFVYKPQFAQWTEVPVTKL